MPVEAFSPRDLRSAGPMAPGSQATDSDVNKIADAVTKMVNSEEMDVKYIKKHFGKGTKISIVLGKTGPQGPVGETHAFTHSLSHAEIMVGM